MDCVVREYLFLDRQMKKKEGTWAVGPFVVASFVVLLIFPFLPLQGKSDANKGQPLKVDIFYYSKTKVSMILI